jgi:hypothetical protein
VNLSEHDMGRPGKELFVREFFILKGFRVGALLVRCACLMVRPRPSSPASVQALSDRHTRCATVLRDGDVLAEL